MAKTTLMIRRFKVFEALDEHFFKRTLNAGGAEYTIGNQELGGISMKIICLMVSFLMFRVHFP